MTTPTPGSTAIKYWPNSRQLAFDACVLLNASALTPERGFAFWILVGYVALGVIILFAFVCEMSNVEENPEAALKSEWLKDGLFQTNWWLVPVVAAADVTLIMVSVNQGHELLAACMGMVYFAGYYMQFDWRNQVSALDKARQESSKE